MADQINFETGGDNAAAPENHDEQMASEFENAGAGSGSDAPADSSGDGRPDWLPDNFDTPEAFAESFKEQQSTLTKAQQELAELRKAGEKSGDDAEGETEGSEDEGSEDGDKASNRTLTEEDLADYTTELAENGDLSEESRTKLLEQFDVPDFVMDTYIEGVKAISERQTSTIDNAFGGEEAKDAMLGWAGENLSETEQNTLDKQFASGDMNSVLFAIDALKTKYEAAEGKAPTTRLNGKGGDGGSSAYQSWSEVTAAMNDPRYHDDPAYRSAVIEKMRGFNG